MLRPSTKREIEDFVSRKPRVIQEIAELLGKNWRTADRYVDKIAEQDGTIATRVFREGTRGAIKVVYWNIHKRVLDVQDKLLENIDDIKPSEILMHVDDSKKESKTVDLVDDSSPEEALIPALKDAKKELLCFSKDLSWVSREENKKSVLETIRGLCERKVKVDVICKIGPDSFSDLHKLMKINDSISSAIDVRSSDQPLTGFVIDSEVAILEEVGEEGSVTFHIINDEPWVRWLKKVFLMIYERSKRLEGT